jgi:hypothetical protein
MNPALCALVLTIPLGGEAIDSGVTMLEWRLLRPLGNCIALPTMTAIDTDVLAPFEIWEVLYGDKTIKFYEPLMLTPNIMPDDPDEPSNEVYLQVVNPELSIHVNAEDRDELLSWVHSEIRMNWKHFVSEEDRNLSANTLALKRKYLTIAELVDG